MIYETFIDFLESGDFELNLESEQLLNQLAASLEGIQTADQHIEALRGSIDEEKGQLFEENEELIREILFLELVSRYQGQTARTKASFKFDSQFDRAIELLSETASIESILDGNS